MNTQIDLHNPITIRAYFEKVRELSKSGEQYPVSLDEVWPLVYPRKDHAIRALKKDSIQDVDYQVFPIFGEKGRPEESYRLTTSCMEHFIARKVRPVFDVYREVFHRLADQIEQPTLPLTPMEILVQQMQGLVLIGQQMVETQRDLAEVKADLQELKQIQQTATAELMALPAPTSPLAEMSTESKIIRLINAYAQAKITPQQEVWRFVYSELYYRYHISVNSYKLNPGESKLQALKRHGHLDEVFTVASNSLQL